MTTRAAELCMALVMMVFSGYLMWKSTELTIGWVPEEGPGGGFWPFWLAAIMLISCLGIIFNWHKRKSPPSLSTEAYFQKGVFVDVAAVAVALIVTVALFSVIGVYGAVPLFFIFYMRFMGKHSWVKSLAFALGAPVFLFMFFEILIKVTLPKGYTEPLFYPLYEFFY